MIFGLSDMAYTIKKGNERSDRILEYLKIHNIIDLRFGINLVTVKCKNSVGDLNNLLDTFIMLKEQGFNLHLYLFLSDDIANAGQGCCPEGWKQDALEAIVEKLANDCAECLNILKHNNIKISSYTVGNESEWGVCGFRLRDRIPVDDLCTDENFHWLREHLWKPTAMILSKCCNIIRTLNSDVKIIIHSDSIGKESFTYEYVKYLEEIKVNYDVIGLTYNPWTIWDEDYDDFYKIKRTLSKLKQWSKPIWFLEYCYPNQLVTNGELTEVIPKSKNYYTRDGQTQFHIDFLNLCKDIHIEQVFFWRAEHEFVKDISKETGMFNHGEFDPKILDCIHDLQQIGGENGATRSS